MSARPGAASTPILGAVLVAIAAVVAWRVAVLALARTDPGEASLVVQALLAAVGLTFLVCGLLVFLKLPGRASVLFVGFCIGSGLHWGGPIEPAAGGLRTALILFYLLVSGILVATLLLHLALEFPERWRLADRKPLVGLLYAPLGLAAVLMAVSLVSPTGSGLRSTTQEWFLLVHTIVSNLFGVLALALFVARMFGAGSTGPRKKYAGLIVAGMLFAWLPYIVASAVGVVDRDPWNLTVAVLPVSFAIAFFGIHAAAGSGTPQRDGRPASKSPVSILLVTVAAFAATSAAAEPAKPENSGLVLPSETCRGLFIVPVTFGDGEGTTLDLLLDTGSSWTFLDPGALRKLAGGEIRAGKVSFQGGRIGRHELGPLRVYALPMRDLSLAVGRQLDGILGFPAFRDVLLTLDYPAQQARVSSGSLPRPDGREVFRAPGKRPHLATVIGGRRVKLLLDSGFTGRFQVQPSHRLAWSVEPRPATSSVVVGGFVVKDGGRLDGAVRFGPLAFEDPVVILGEGEGQVGWHVLRHFVLTFDQQNKRMRMQTDRAGPVRMAPLVDTGVAYDPRPEGLEVVRVFPGSSVEAAGLREGDLIVAIDGVPVHERGCDGSRSDVAGRQQVFSYIRDGIRAEAEIETEVLVP